MQNVFKRYEFVAILLLFCSLSSGQGESLISYHRLARTLLLKDSRVIPLIILGLAEVGFTSPNIY